MRQSGNCPLTLGALLWNKSPNGRQRRLAVNQDMVKGHYHLKHSLLFVAQHFLGHERFVRYCGAAQGRLNDEILAAARERPSFRSREIARFDRSLSRAEFESLCHQPLLFRGAAADWACTRKWSFDFFKHHYGSANITLNDNRGLFDFDHAQRFAKLTLAEYIEAIEAGGREYLKFDRDLLQDHPRLMADLDLVWLRARRVRHSLKLEEILLFMSPAGTLTPTHSGTSGNWFVQVVGKKNWTLFPVSDTIYLDPRTDRTFYYYSKVKPDELGDPCYPLARLATRTEVTLEPGDVLWVPPFVWHHIYNPTPSVGVTYRVMSFPASFRAAPLLMTLIFFATRPNPIAHLLTSRLRRKTASFQRRFGELSGWLLPRLP